MIESIERLFSGTGRRTLDSQVFEDAGDQFQPAQRWIDHIDRPGAVLQTVEEDAAHGGFAGTDLTGEQHESHTTLYAVGDLFKDALMRVGKEQKAWVRCYRKRNSAQTEKVGVNAFRKRCAVFAGGSIKLQAIWIPWISLPVGSVRVGACMRY
jgi:hypothetical protein